MSSSRDPTSSRPLVPPSGGTESGEDDIHAWFTDLDGRRFLTASINRTPVLDLRLSELCAYVDQLVDLQEARIFSTESYAEWIGQIKHRFLVLELLRMRKPKDACLRLDRRRGENTSILRVVAPLGNNEANDRAMFTISKRYVIQPGTIEENRQTFERQPTLNQLRAVLKIVCDALGGYRVWPNNCWAFCSVIQQLLESAHGGSFERGRLQHADISPAVQKSVYLHYISAVCAARSAAGEESLQSAPHQPSQAQRSADVGGGPHPLARLEPVAPNVPDTAQPSVINQYPLQPGLPEGTWRQDTSLSDPNMPQPTWSQAPPTISRVIPNTGSLAGGIEIAVFGSRFVQSSRCFFGPEEATITEQREGFLICILPQGREPGSVSVTTRVGGATANDNGGTLPPLFTYQDDSYLQ